jgi:hypothetical protein
VSEFEGGVVPLTCALLVATGTAARLEATAVTAALRL